MRSFCLEALYIVVRMESKALNFLIVYDVSLESIVGSIVTKSKEIVYIGYKEV